MEPLNGLLPEQPPPLAVSGFTFDPRNLEIKTKSIEQTLVPLVTQISSLVNFKENVISGNRPKSERALRAAMKVRFNISCCRFQISIFISKIPFIYIPVFWNSTCLCTRILEISYLCISLPPRILYHHLFVLEISYIRFFYLGVSDRNIVGSSGGAFRDSWGDNCRRKSGYPTGNV